MIQRIRSPLLLSLLTITIISAAALALRYPVADMPLERDKGEYAYIAQCWLDGEVPYKESFDRKPPGVFAAFAVILHAAKTGSSPSVWKLSVNRLVICS